MTPLYFDLAFYLNRYAGCCVSISQILFEEQPMKGFFTVAMRGNLTEKEIREKEERIKNTWLTSIWNPTFHEQWWWGKRSRERIELKKVK